ncbi:hypothetical protein GCM10010441_29300 [Kitasatospora paracochleata]|uniref:Uncharacterized protein n=1 Tax=Kitasatospora paracochleata TaxID=58354 RepID=A0ABT1JA20_9ACTN|nr:hypothetical protein [Kitasatospora paracochleata]MCP2313891.1 hypothetical protein [Kitasatospora paracochleata]
MEKAEEVAGDLFAALLKETAEWADDSEQGWVDGLWAMPPGEALTAMEESNCLPGQLAGPAAAALRFLAPHVYGVPG